MTPSLRSASMEHHRRIPVSRTHTVHAACICCRRNRCSARASRCGQPTQVSASQCSTCWRALWHVICGMLLQARRCAHLRFPDGRAKAIVSLTGKPCTEAAWVAVRSDRAVPKTLQPHSGPCDAPNRVAAARRRRRQANVDTATAPLGEPKTTEPVICTSRKPSFWPRPLP